MDIIKEFQEKPGRVAVRTETYGSSLDKMMALYEEAKKDFPGLQTQDVAITHYAGDRIRRTWGIEFCAPDAPANYARVNKLELIF